MSVFIILKCQSKGGGKRGHNVVDKLLLVIVSMPCKPGNICCGHKMFLKEIRNIFVSRTQILCPQQMLCAGKQGNICVHNIVSLFATTLTGAKNKISLQIQVQLYHKQIKKP